MQLFSRVSVSLFASAVALVICTAPVSAETDLCVTNSFLDNVLRYDAETGQLLNAIIGGGLDNPWDLGFGPDGNLYVACGVQATVKRFNGVTGAFVDTVVSSHAGGLIWGGWIEFGPNNTLLVGDYDGAPGSKGILKFDLAVGNYLGVFVSKGDHGMNYPNGMRIGPNGNLFVRAEPSQDLFQYDSSTGAYLGIAVPAGNGGAHGGAGIVFDAAGRIFLSGQQTNKISYFDGSTGAFLGDAVPSGPPANFNGPLGMAFDPSGNFFVADDNNNSIKRFDATTFAFEGLLQYGAFLRSPVMLTTRPRPPGVPISGHVNLQDFDGELASQSVEVVFQDSFLGTGGETKTVQLDANGDFTTTTTVRMRTVVCVKGSHWLRRCIGNYTIPDEGLTGLSFSLVNGDCDDDNEITLVDVGILAASFGKAIGDAGYDARADLDGDDEVTLVDFGILSAHFGESGD